jgi:hypothetical protein
MSLSPSKPNRCSTMAKTHPSEAAGVVLIFYEED